MTDHLHITVNHDTGRAKHCMTEELALSTSTGFVDMDGLLGYFGFAAANFLVGTGKYEFHQSCAWGYVLRRRTPRKGEA